MAQCFRNILVVVEGTSRDKIVVDRAAMISAECRAKMTLMRVLEPVPEQVGWLAEGYPPPLDLQAVQHKNAESELAALTQFAEQRDISPKVRLLSGKPYVEIIKTVLKKHHDLIVCAGEASNRLAAALFSHTSRQLMRKAPCPVWSIKPTAEHAYRRVLAAVAIPHDRTSRLNYQILDLATRLAEQERAECLIVHSWQPSVVPEVPHWSEATQESLKKWLDQTRQRHQAWLQKLAAEYGFSEDDQRLFFLRGDPSTKIPELVEEKGVDLVVMGTVCRTGVTGLIMGNTAERVLNEIECSALTIKPEGFVSPVH